ncbi:MAG TPA: peptidoglycan bridge formation glycyltransferase FemA/FemB family protein [Thermomicrobiales bacterium]
MSEPAQTLPSTPTLSVVRSAGPAITTLSGVEWDRELERLGGNLLQSWRWGEFKQRQGWHVERIAGRGQDGAWMAQVLLKRFGPISIAYVPCGPTLEGDHQAIFPDLLAALDEVCRANGAVTLVMEPNQRFALPGTYKQHGLVKWMRPIQPRQTLQIPTLDDDALLAGMHHKKRYHVRLAIRQGITVKAVPADSEAISTFYDMYVQTTRRQGIACLHHAFFTDLAATFGQDATVFFAMADGAPAAAAFCLRFGPEATYLSAASAPERRGQAAGAYLIYEIVRYYRDRGCAQVDLGNVQPEGLRNFKTGFGGNISIFPAPMERRYRPVASWLVRRVVASRIPA